MEIKMHLGGKLKVTGKMENGYLLMLPTTFRKNLAKKLKS
jgi:hypothetical protein